MLNEGWINYTVKSKKKYIGKSLFIICLTYSEWQSEFNIESLSKIIKNLNHKLRFMIKFLKENNVLNVTVCVW